MGKNVKVDFKELQDFQKEFEKVSASLQDEFLRACAAELAARLLRKVIKRTPVGEYEAGSGKVGGTLRRGWTTGDEKTAMYTALFGGGEGGSGGTGSQKQVFGKGSVSENAKGYANGLQIEKHGDTYVVEITNPVEYASYVEYGHRTRGGKEFVPGKLMMTLSAQEIRSIAPALLRKRLEEKLKEAFR